MVYSKQTSIKTMDYRTLRNWGEMGTSISSERASQEEQNGANFSSIAPSSEELRASMLASNSNGCAW